MPYGANDLRTFCSTGVPVSFNGVSTYFDGQPILGLFDRPLQARLGDQGAGGVDLGFPELRIPYNTFNPMPTNGDALTIDGVNYTVDDMGADDDGAFLFYGLKLASGPPASTSPSAPGSDAMPLSIITNVTLSAYQAIAETGTGLAYADASDVQFVDKVLGISANGALAGGTINIQSFGAIEYAGWNWTPGAPVFVGPLGSLTQNAPSSGFIQIVGVAFSPTQLLIELQTPIVIN